MNLSQLVTRVQTAMAALSMRQLASLAIAFVTVVAVTIGSAYWVRTPSYGVLFSDMDPESAGTVVAKLKNDKVTFLIDDGGRTVRVPTTRVDELRLDFASQGLPTSGHVGFEIFDRTAFGVTDFLEHVNYRRALEGELARTISTIGEVAGARVHLAMPQPSLFTGQEQPTKASVVLKLRNNHQLPASTVTAITSLVAASVEALRPESVVIIDNYGRPLARAEDGSDEAPGGMAVERQQRIEHDLSTRVVALLEPILGAGHVRVNVSAKLNANTQEETEERWDPTPVVRSHESITQTASSTNGSAGMAGSRANLPPTSTKPQDSAKAGTSELSQMPLVPGLHTAETTNYEVSKVTRHRVEPRGQVARLSVAVVVDDDHVQDHDKNGALQLTAKPRTAADIQKVHDLVAAAVGLDADRGDLLTVENIAFEETPVEEGPAPSRWQQYAPQLLEVGRIVGVVLLGVLGLFGVIKPMIRGSLAGMPVPKGSAAVSTQTLPRSVQDLESEIDAQLQAAAEQNSQGRRLPVLTKRVATLAQREPENAARLLRTWLTEEDR